MKYTLEEKFKFIHECIIKENSTNPIEIVKNIMHKEFINMHGPEHHFLDGASFLVAEKSVRKIFPEKKMIAGGVRWHRERLRYAG